MTLTLQDVIVASLKKQAGRAELSAGGQMFLNGTFDLKALVADIELWALGGRAGADDIERIIRNADGLNTGT